MPGWQEIPASGEPMEIFKQYNRKMKKGITKLASGEPENTSG